jgi:hypothetical protein
MTQLWQAIVANCGSLPTPLHDSHLGKTQYLLAKMMLHNKLIRISIPFWQYVHDTNSAIHIAVKDKEHYKKRQQQ